MEALGGLPLADGFAGRIPASGAPLTARTLALRPNPQSLAPGPDNRTSSDVLADAVYGFLQNHPGLGVPEEGQRNLAEFVRGVNQLTPWGSAEGAVNSAKAGDLVGTTSNLAGALPIVSAAGGVAARVGKTAVKDAGETVASNLAKRAVLTTGADATESAAPAAAEATAPAITGQVSAGASASPPIVAYHGSPYSFDRFDSSKIGTGEGAQAYGHGLYFAENEGVAKGYRDQLASDTYYTPDGQMFDPQSQLQHLNVRVAARNNGSDLDAIIARAQELLPKASEQTQPMLQHDIGVLQSFKDAGGISKNPGSMYQVGINADPNSFLDWDKPFNQQSPTVQQALSGIVSPQDAAAYHFGYAPEEFASLPADRQTQLIAQTPSTARDNLLPQTGADIVKKFGGGAEAADALNKMGISGVKYLDQGSRVAGDGTSNYVLFNDSLASILKKYGLAGLGTAGGAAALTAGGQSSLSPSPAEAAEPPLSDQQSPPPSDGSSPGFDDWWRQLQAQRFSGQQPF